MNCGRVVIVKKNFTENSFAKNLKKVIRKADFKDIERLEKMHMPANQGFLGFEHSQGVYSF